MTIQELYNYYKESGAVVTTDSRDCPQGSIFFALKGESFDGNRFAEQALEKGCAIAVVDDREVYDNHVAAHGDDSRMMLVPSVLQAFKDFAREHRRTFTIPVIGITGTNGKTTTKELLRAVLSEKFRVMATEGNFNNDVGVPKTLLRLAPEHEIAVVEMGASHPGDIATLTQTAEPTCGLITNVGKAHLQGFGSFEGVVSTKGELYRDLATRAGSTIFVNDDNNYLTDILPTGVAVERYSQHSDNAGAVVQGEVIACDPFLRLRWRRQGGEWHEVKTQLIGSYNLDNVLAAATVGLHFGVGEDEISHAIANYVPSNNRSQLTITEHNRLIVDAYNANPTSMQAAIENFERMAVSPKLAILGEMRELGESSHEEHRRIVEQLKQCHFDDVWLIGEEFTGHDDDFIHLLDVEEVKIAVKELKLQGYYILIKGSNGTRLYELPPLL